MKKIFIAVVIILLLSLSGCLNRPNYSCKVDSDCVHTCGAKCANQEWAKITEIFKENFWDATKC